MFTALASGLTAGPAFAADPTAVLTIAKTASAPEARPGETISWEISVGCTSLESMCVNGTVRDSIPAPFQLVDVNVIGADKPSVVTKSGNDFTVAFQETSSRFPGITGMYDGQRATVEVVTTLPSSTPVDANDVTVTNTATITADNALTQSASAQATPKVSAVVNVATTKSWQQKTQTVGSSAQNVATIGISNTSNVPATSMTITDPAAGTNNPFDLVVFNGFGPLVMPGGADRVTVTATTATGSVTGDPATTLALPAGVAAGDVTGLSFTFTSTTGQLDAGGAKGSVQLAVVQRTSAAQPGQTVNVVNTATGSVATPRGSASTNAADVFQIVPLSLSVVASKSFADPKIVATKGTSVTLAAKNASNVPLTALTITEPAGATSGNPATPDFVANHLTFDGFGRTGNGNTSSGGAWPSGADTASITFHYTDGDGPASTVTSTTGWPTPDSGRVVRGFTVVYAGMIAPGASASVPFAITTALDTPATVDNTVQVDGSTAEATATPSRSTARLTVDQPVVKTATDKILFPAIVGSNAGEQLVTNLIGTVTGSNVNATRIILEDSPNASGSTLWGAFTAEQLTATPVPAGATLTVQTWDGSTWTTAPGGIFSGAQTVNDFALPSAAQGIRLVFDLAAPGYANTESVAGKLVFRSATAQPVGTTFTNCAVSQGFGSPAPDGPRPSVCRDFSVGPGDGGSGHVSLVAQSTSKTWSPSALWIPESGAYPTSDLAVGISNDSPLPAETLSLDDPTAGTNPFEYVDLIALKSISIPKGSDPASTTIRLVDSSGNTIFAETGANAIAHAVALSPAALADVTGFHVDVAGTIDTNQKVTVTATTRLRTVTRSTSTPIEPAVAALGAVVPNTVTGVATANGGADRLSKTATASLTIRPIREQPLAAQLTKTLDPSVGTVLSPDPNRAVALTLAIARTDGNPIRYVVDDSSPTFWNAFELKGLTSIGGTKKAGVLTARVDYLTGGTFGVSAGRPVVTGGTWKAGKTFSVPAQSGALPTGAADLPSGVTAAAVQGVRVTFETTDGSVIPDFTGGGINGQRVVFSVVPRETLRTGGPVGSTSSAAPMPGETALGTVTNDATAVATNVVRSVNVDPAHATFVFAPGATALQISKTPKNNLVRPGDPIPFKLSVTNTGTTPLVNPVFTDVIPTDATGPLLTYDPNQLGDPSFAATPSTATITTDPSSVKVALAADRASVAVTFPAGSRLMPGETYVVTLPMAVRAGVARDTQFDNGYTFTADGGVMLRDTANIRVLEGASYWNTKDVKEDVPAGDAPTGLYNTTTGASTCVDDGGFYRVPCLVKTQPGGTETWRLRSANTGNLPTKALEIVDVLPFAGDTGTSSLLSGLSRGSQWSPSYLGDLTFEGLPTGATTTVYYQTAADKRCVFTGDYTSADPYGTGCAADQWHLGQPSDLSTVTALKFAFTFPTELQPGDRITVTYRTRTVSALPSGASAHNSPAWNSMVVFSTTDKGSGILQFQTIEPNKAGVAFATPEPGVAVGDRVWSDLNRNGRQDAGEPGVGGVGVTLFTASGKKVAQTTTGPDGLYVFDGLFPGNYYIQFALTADQARVYGFTAKGAGSDVRVDSNADVATGRTAVFTLGAAGPTLPQMIDTAGYTAQVVKAAYIDPTIDAGLLPKRVSVGDWVWDDANRNGIQDAGEHGIPGVILKLTGPDGGAVTDVRGLKVGPVATDSTGHYLFADLPVLRPGQHYTVTIDKAASAGALTNFVPTKEHAGNDRSVDSSTRVATSGDLVADGQTDLTLDFGFYDPPSGGAGGLAHTGSDIGGWMILGLVLLGGGAALAVAVRVRRRASR